MNAHALRRPRAGRAGVLALLAVLALLGSTLTQADPGRFEGGERHGRHGRGDTHPPRFHPRVAPYYPQPIYVPPPVYYAPPPAPGISLFLPFNLRR